MRQSTTPWQVIAALLVLLPWSATVRAGNPLDDATVVWHMNREEGHSGQPQGLSAHGQVTLGCELQGEEREASLRRGGDGRVAQFDGGYLQSREELKPVNLVGKAMTLCLRVRFPIGRGEVPIIGRVPSPALDDGKVPYGKILAQSGGFLSYTWQTEPAARRIQGLGKGTYGFNGESNDQHNLASYQPGVFALSTMTLEESDAVTLFHNGEKVEGRIDIAKHDLGDEGFRIGAKRNGSEFLNGDIAEILVYDRVLSQGERLALEKHLSDKWSLSGAKRSAREGKIPGEGLVLNLDAAAASAETRGMGGGRGPLKAWRDASVSQRSYTQDDPDQQPMLIPGALAGKPVVRFAGHHWLEGPAVLPRGAKHFTFVAVWRRSEDTRSQVVFEQSSPGTGRRACLLATGSAAARGSGFLDGTLQVGAPETWIDPNAWHDVIVRFRGPNLELFLDGVLVDEEWPHGALARFCGPLVIGAAFEKGSLQSGFKGQIDHLALWNRALKDEEIVALSGGKEEVARRDRELLGPRQTSMQYWKPRGQAYAGDCIPFYYDGAFHMFYLFDRRHHRSKWGLGAHQYAHVSTRDLIHWTHHPMAVPIVEQWECAMGTGDVIFNPRDKTLYVFYTDCGSRAEFNDKPQKGSWIFAARSTDGVHFHKDLKPIVPGGDCEVFCDPATGLFHLIRGGGNRLVSADLAHWEDVPGDFVTRKPGTSGECPNHFEWNGWFYFILGTNALWKSRGALGPWEEIPPTVYDGLYVPKVAEFTGNRRLMAGFLGSPAWGGHVALRELIQYPDGTLGAKFAPELIPATGEPLTLSLSSPDSHARWEDARIHVRGTERRAVGTLSGVPRDVRITMRVVPQPGAKAFGLCLRGKGDCESGCLLRFQPEQRQAEYGTIVKGERDRNAVGRICGGRDYALPNVEGLDRPFTLDIVVKGSIVDTCIDQRRTMISRRSPEPDGDRLFFFAEGGEVTFEDIVVRPLLSADAFDERPRDPR